MSYIPISATIGALVGLLTGTMASASSCDTNAESSDVSETCTKVQTYRRPIFVLSDDIARHSTPQSSLDCLRVPGSTCQEEIVTTFPTGYFSYLIPLSSLTITTSNCAVAVTRATRERKEVVVVVLGGVETGKVRPLRPRVPVKPC